MTDTKTKLSKKEMSVKAITERHNRAKAHGAFATIGYDDVEYLLGLCAQQESKNA